MHKSGMMLLSMRGESADDTAIRKNLSRCAERKGSELFRLGPLAQMMIGDAPFFNMNVFFRNMQNFIVFFTHLLAKKLLLASTFQHFSTAFFI